MFKTVKNTLIALSATAALLAGQNAFAHSAHCEDTPLGDLMEGMKTDLKAYVGAFKSSDSATMQTSVDKLLAASVKAKDYTPLKLQDDQPMPNMTAEQHANMGSMKGMPNMEGMSHATHMKHMKYLQGMDQLNGLFSDLKAAGSDKKQVKQLLGKIKQHSKSSHEAFRKDCD